MTKIRNSIEDDMLMTKMKDILLREDRYEIQQLQANFQDDKQLAERVLPLIEKRMDFLKETFPKEFERVIDGMLDKKIQRSQKELLDVMHPIVGRMVAKYIQMQIELLKESIEVQLDSAFGKRSWLTRTKNRFLGVKEIDFLLSNINAPIIQEVYIIQHHSGILMGSASLEKVIDRDMIAGMLTAIKSFVEDAFQRDREELELIEYGTYKIIIQNFHTYYLAAAVSGSLTITDRSDISQRLLDFGETHLKKFTSTTVDYYIHCSRLLHDAFIGNIPKSPTN
jgi:hypothetical protein